MRGPAEERRVAAFVDRGHFSNNTVRVAVVDAEAPQVSGISDKHNLGPRREGLGEVLLALHHGKISITLMQVNTARSGPTSVRHFRTKIKLNKRIENGWKNLMKL